MKKERGNNPIRYYAHFIAAVITCMAGIWITHTDGWNLENQNRRSLSQNVICDKSGISCQWRKTD